MVCPACKSENLKVLESRDTDGCLAIRRRRECENCWYRFTTFERIEMASFMVVKKNWKKESYDRNKVEKWVLLACSKRPVTSEKIDSFFIKLEQKWSWEWKEIDSKKIWNDVMEALKELDDVAYIRFISVYKNLSAEAIKEELSKFLNK